MMMKQKYISQRTTTYPSSAFAPSYVRYLKDIPRYGVKKYIGDRELRSTEANLKKEDELLRLEEKLRVEKLRSTEANAKSFSKNKTSYQKHDGNTELCTVVHSDLRNGDLKARIDNQTRGIDIEKLMKEQDRAQGLDHKYISQQRTTTYPSSAFAPSYVRYLKDIPSRPQ
ncbi:hypothetical protein OUZ56_018783 [Daphnia magna]|uniref:Uncharacterized protein n=1 Tax=Daphnia magna TaxID=35525 RepID=A0ABQ9Z9S9_9CRUS|nr:hypothetical protein OUZ56_018783 [Daphnia magna]